LTIRYCSLASGSSGNCHFLSSGRTRVLVDVGRSMRYIRDALQQIDEDLGDIQTVFISHEHTDHVSGLGPLARRYGFMLAMHKATYEAIGDQLDGVSKDRICLIDAGSFHLDDFEIEAFTLSHDAENTFGFTFSNGPSKIGIATDLGYVDNAVRKNLEACELISIDCNYDDDMLENGPYPRVIKERIFSKKGHLSNQNVGDLLTTLQNNGQLRSVLLAHMSAENNHPALALSTIKDVMHQSGIFDEKAIKFEVAKRNSISDLHVL